MAGFLVSLPFYFLRMWRRGGWQAGFGERFGVYDARFKQAITNRHTLWMHAVSVGEVNVCTQLIRVLEPRLPNLKIVVSTTTTTGMGELQAKLPNHISKIYYPIDRRKWVNRALATVRPEAIVLVEAEIWPNFLWRALDYKIPIFLVNARLSERSYRGYKRLGFLFRRLFRSLAGVGAQNQSDAQRLQKLGCQPDAIHIVGSLKFDAAKLEEARALDIPALLARLGVASDAPVLVAGSTHDGEEAILAEMLNRLRSRFPSLFLVLVPRHFERGKDVGKVLNSLKVKFAYRSELGTQTQFGPGALDCLVVNTTGELRHFYRHATVIFVGKSLTAEGGQNPIEPAALAKPIVFGPNMGNFAEIVRALLADDAAIQVANAEDLENTVSQLLADPVRCAVLAQNAVRVVNKNLGAIERTADMIIQRLEGRDLYIAPRRK
jgi:3-deoxy-D-manno-octulosonic-acid transferase